jgi:hypothetical protein
LEESWGEISVELLVEMLVVVLAEMMVLSLEYNWVETLDVC